MTQSSSRRDEAQRAETAAATEPAARRRVLDLLAASSHPVDAQAVADALGVHVTTARFHLEQLEASGLVQRRPMQEKRRGRPRIGYSPSGTLRAADAREQLIEVLAGALGGKGLQASLNAGEGWADALEAPDESDPLDTLADVLDRLGFEPERAGDDILMHGCPFRDAARERPDVVCSVHQGLVQRMYERAGGAPSGVRLLPFVEPELCKVAALER